jgi:PHP family Zn ribbon phosphoesterase
VFFRCANQYTRVYRERDGQSYRPVCPKCGQSMRIGVAPGGSEKRLFELSC